MPSYKLKTISGQTVIHHPYPPEAQRPPITNCIKVVTIDPGTRNISLGAGYKMAGMQPVISCMELFDATQGVDSNTDQLFGNLTRWLMKYTQTFREAHYIIIERQRDENYMAIRVAQHVLSFVMMVVLDSPCMPTIVELDNKVKTKTCPKGANKREYKRWSVIQFSKYLVAARDLTTLQFMTSQSKMDDLSDIWQQVQAFMAECGIVWYDTTCLDYSIAIKFEFYSALPQLQQPPNTVKEIMRSALQLVSV